MQKYMVMVQHNDQKVAYIEFKSVNDKQAKIDSVNVYKNYVNEKFFQPSYAKGTSGNFTGVKPAIRYYSVSKWVESQTATNAWGQLSGGYWQLLKDEEKTEIL